MPVYIRFDGVDGSVWGSGNGGVWKTSNFLTADPVGPVSREPGLPGVTVFLDQNHSSGLNPRPKIKTYICPSDSSVVEVTSISRMQGGGGVEGRDPAAGVKVEQLIRSARSGGPMGKLYVATNTGVYQRADAQGRLLVGSDQGVWRSGDVNNLRQLGIGSHNTASVEIIVADDRGTVISSHRLSGVSVTAASGTFTLTFNGQTTGG